MQGDPKVGYSESYFESGIHNVPFRFDVRNLLPASGGSKVDLYRLVTVVHDASINQAWALLSDTDPAATGIAVLELQLIQERADGVRDDISDTVSLAEVTDSPVLLPIQRELLVVGFPLYLRIGLTPGAVSSWFDSLQSVNGAVHFMGTR